MEKNSRTLMMELYHTNKEWLKHMKNCAHEVGIPEPYRVIIMYLSRTPGASQKELAAYAGKTTAAINQTVKEMEAEGYIRKETDAKDGRYTRLYATDKGMEKATLARERIRQSDERITCALTPEKEKELTELLLQLRRVIEEEL